MLVFRTNINNGQIHFYLVFWIFWQTNNFNFKCGASKTKLSGTELFKISSQLWIELTRLQKSISHLLMIAVNCGTPSLNQMINGM